jgi:CDP-glucose 4,6-dehydratase
MTAGFWEGRRVLVTGHTGFKGSWLVLMLHDLGAEVSGFALAPPTDPALFDVARIGELLNHHVIGDLRDPAAVGDVLASVKPEVIFNLAAQPLVRQSYAEPIETFATNVMGSVNLLEAARRCPSLRCLVNVTTDKCYRNNEWPWPYRESEPLGGRDPYSASKACAELVTAAYRDSFLGQQGVAVASARAGNVIGGGDWATDRLLPDFFRALDAGQPLEVRSPDAVRPWQHVLDPLSGYIALAEAAHATPERFGRAWNFGPQDANARPVRWILDHLGRRHGAARWTLSNTPQVHEAHQLRLDSSQARAELGWRAKWSLPEALDATDQWHSAWRAGQDMRAFSHDQITAHRTAAVG